MKRFFTKTKLIIITLFIGAGFFMSSNVSDNYFEISKNLDVFATLYRELNIYYVDETKPGELMKTAIDNMLATLDPYTSYIPESQIEDYRYMQTGEYGGIGALIRQDSGYVIISEPYEGYPAQKAGLMAGDKILKVNGLDVKNKTTSEVSKFLKGQASTEIVMLIEREGTDEAFEVNLNREAIKINSVSYAGMIEPSVGYVKLTGFTENAAEEVKKAVLDLKKDKKMTSLIFDLRGNPGGLLNEAVAIVNLFVDKGTDVVSTRGKIKDQNREYKATSLPIDNNMPIAVLIDQSSASASEIVAGALQDLDRGVVIGQRSYGKGLVQQTRPLSYNAHLKVTIAKYYIPSGRCIQALDYSHHNADGSVDKVADSLKSAFTTKNGRVVYDGGGVAPDVKLEAPEYSGILRSLVSKSLIFKYATTYRLKHPEISSAKDFSITDEEYKDFSAYLTNKEYTYKMPVEDALESLSEYVEKDTLLSSLQEDIKALQTKVNSFKKEDLTVYKPEVKAYLEEEISSRYYYQNGRIESSFDSDLEIKEALSLLKDKAGYDKTLSPISSK